MPTRHATISRREALQIAAGATAIATTGALPSVSQARQTPVPLSIPDSGASIPTEDVTFGYFNSGDYKGTFFRQYFEAYQQKHPNISIDYQGISGAESAKIIPLGIQNGNAPDCFQSIPGISAAQMVQEGWIRPLDDIIPNFEEWKQNFPETVLVEGVSVFDGKLYALPYVSSKQYATLLFYNTQYMEAAGYDPSSQPLSWDDFRTAAKKITKAGQGQYYGFIVGGQQTGRWAQIINNLAELAGGAGGTLDWRTGEYTYASDEVLGAIELILALNADGSIFPGSMSMNAPKARGQFPMGTAGTIMQGTWNIPQWIVDAPDFNFQVASTPLADPLQPAHISYGPGPSIPMFVNAESKYPEIAGDMFHYLGSEEGQRAFATITNGSDRPMLDSAIESADLDERVRTAYDIFDEQLRVHPTPSVRNPDVEQVLLEQQRLSPDFGEIIQGLVAGQLSDAKAAMQDLQGRANADLDRAIKAAQDKGADVSREDWVFPNWDPPTDYTEEMYKELT
ncbi:MAG: extracellular solute-binding protein [Chloroflexota bacterium]|nr:extracellular solute-binding protein [Chloroflexota bacterium]